MFTFDKVIFHLLTEDGKGVQKSVDITEDYRKRPKLILLGDWFKLDESSCFVDKILLGQTEMEIFLKPIPLSKLQ